MKTSVGTYEIMSTKGSTPEELWLGIQERMGDLEGVVAEAHADVALVIVDGPLSHRRHVEGAVGYVKTQHVQYLPEELRGILGTLPVGCATPALPHHDVVEQVLLVPEAGQRDRAAGGLVRCEVKADMTVTEAAGRANMVSASLPRYASARHKTLGLPRTSIRSVASNGELRRRLGDRDLAIRALRRAAAA